MPYDTGFDLLSKNLAKVLQAKSEGQKARQDFQNSMLLAKMKANFEQQAKSGEMKDKFGYDLAMEKEKASMPFKAYQEFQSGQGNPGGAPNVTMGPAGKPVMLSPRQAVERKVMASGIESLNPNEKQIWEIGKKKEFAPNPELTAKTMGNIKSTEDLNHLLDNKDAYKEAGVDVSAIIKNYMNSDTVKQDKTLWQKIQALWSE